MIVAIILFTLIGAATASVMRIHGNFGAWFLLGVGINGALLFIIGRPSIVVALAALPILITFRHRLQRVRVDPTVTIALVPLIAALIVSSLVPLADFDGRTTWLPKAVAIANDHSIRGPFFRSEGGLNLHNHYPLLLPMDVATVMVTTGDLSMDRVRPFFVLIPIAVVIALHEALGWLIVVLAWLPPLAAAHEGGALSAYSDIALAAFVGMGVVAIVNNTPGAGLWLAFAVLTKNEGVILAAAAIVAARRWKIAIPPLIAYAALSLWRHQIPNAYDENYGVLIRDFDIHRMPAAIAALAKHAFAFSTWGVFWILVAAAMAFAVAKKQFFLPAAIALSLAAYTVAFTVTSWNPSELANVAADRLLLHIVVPSLLLLRSVKWSLHVETSRTRRGTASIPSPKPRTG